jgi:isoleucyl-tRNA synthetase
LWLAPILCFTAEEAWLSRYPDAESVHLNLFDDVPKDWCNDALAAKWAKVRDIRRVVTGALEIERAQKRIGSSLEAAPIVYLASGDLHALVEGLDFAEICITSGIEFRLGDWPETAFHLPDVAGVYVVSQPAKGRKCARSWKFSEDVGQDQDYPDVSLRDARALRELKDRGLL